MTEAAWQSTWSAAKRSRVEAAARRRRLIFNDDTHELALDDAATPEGFLAHRIAPLADTQVGTIAWSVLCGQFDAPCYDCRVQPIYGEAHGEPLQYWPRVTANVKALVRAGHCPLQLVIDFAHQHGKEAFASVRMNDVHDSFMDPNAMTVWKRTHPEFLVDTRGMLPEFELYTTAQDFSHREVRQRKLEIFQDICERYDVDGFELDYIRHPVLFSRRMRGESCTPEEIGIVNSLMRQIRGITDAAARRRDRPLLLAARVPDSFALCLDNGMDIQGWLDQDLVDILIAGGGYAPSSLLVEEWVRSARPHGVPVYPCVNQSAVTSASGGSFLEAVRGLASSWHRAGADGLYFWNLGTPFEFMAGDDLERQRAACYACLYDAGEVGTLVGKSKRFCADTRGDVHSYYAHVSGQWPLPMESKRGILRTGVIGRVPLMVGDDIKVTPPSRATLLLAFAGTAWREALQVHLNGHELAPGKSGEEGRLEFTVPVQLLRGGRNFVEIAARHGGLPESIVTIGAIALRLEYGVESRGGAHA
jgi:hypothetical protein